MLGVHFIKYHFCHHNRPSLPSLLTRSLKASVFTVLGTLEWIALVGGDLGQALPRSLYDFKVRSPAFLVCFDRTRNGRESSFLFHLTQGKILFICLSIGEAKLRSSQPLPSPRTMDYYPKRGPRATYWVKIKKENLLFSFKLLISHKSCRTSKPLFIGWGERALKERKGYFFMSIIP